MLNIDNRTKIFGVGIWKDCRQWQLDWLKSETSFYHRNVNFI